MGRVPTNEDSVGATKGPSPLRSGPGNAHGDTPPKAVERRSSAQRRKRKPVDTLLRALIHISNEFGRPLTEAEVRAACPIADPGMTTETFIWAARRLDYRVRRTPIGAHNIDTVPTPFIVLADAGIGAIVVTRNDEGAFFAVRTFNGTRGALSKDEILKLGNEILLIAPLDTDQETHSWRGVVVRRIRGILGQLILASLLINVFALASPLFVMTVYNKVIGQGAVETLQVLAMGMLILYAFDLTLRAIRGYVSSHTGARLDALLGSEVIHHLIHLPYQHFETTPTGIISERLRQLETIRQFCTGQMPMVLVDLAFVVVFIAVLSYLSTVLALIVLAAIPIFVLVSVAFHRTQRGLVEENFKALAAKTSTLAETVSNALTIKSLGLESEIEGRWGKRLAASAWTGFRTNNLSNIVSAIGNTLQQLASLAIIVAGAVLIMGGEMNIGSLIAASILSSRALAPMRQVVGAWNQLQEVRAAFRRIDEIMDEPNEMAVNERPPAPNLKGDIAFEKVTFRYDPELPPAITELDLSIDAGQILCIIGPSGSGKSTLAKLAAGLYVPDSGRVLVDQTDIRHLSPHSLRKQFGIVPQDIQLFAGTVRENIAMGAPGLDHERIAAVCKLVGAHEFIQRLPNGYDTVLTERGGGLSMGQRQLLCIARALIRNPRVILLDEPTSALDSATEERVLQTIRRLAGNRTIIIISHRLAPGAIADRVALLIDGRIAAVGTPSEIAKLRRTNPSKAASTQQVDKSSGEPSQSHGVGA